MELEAAMDASGTDGGGTMKIKVTLFPNGKGDNADPDFEDADVRAGGAP